MLNVKGRQPQGALSVFAVSRTVDRFDATFDHDGLVANAGLIVIATLMCRLGLERSANRWVRTGSHAPGHKISNAGRREGGRSLDIDQVGVLRAGATQTVLPFKVMAPSTIGTFLRTFTFGSVRQLDAVAAHLPAKRVGRGCGSRR